MYCCGMSMVLKNEKSLDSFILRSKPITNEKFYFLLLIVLVICMINEFLINYSYTIESRKKLGLVDIMIVGLSTIITFILSWALMMLSMTSNVWLLGCMICGKIVMKLICVSKMETKKKTCCI